ncbi:MAG: hypothetical protein R6V19_05910 [Armatimonadota bacterium]
MRKSIAVCVLACLGLSTAFGADFSDVDAHLKEYVRTMPEAYRQLRLEYAKLHGEDDALDEYKAEASQTVFNALAGFLEAASGGIEPEPDVPGAWGEVLGAYGLVEMGYDMALVANDTLGDSWDLFTDADARAALQANLSLYSGQWPEAPSATEDCALADMEAAAEDLAQAVEQQDETAFSTSATELHAMIDRFGVISQTNALLGYFDEGGLTWSTRPATKRGEAKAQAAIQGFVETCRARVYADRAALLAIAQQLDCLPPCQQATVRLTLDELVIHDDSDPIGKGKGECYITVRVGNSTVKSSEIPADGNHSDWAVDVDEYFDTTSWTVEVNQARPLAIEVAGKESDFWTPDDSLGRCTGRYGIEFFNPDYTYIPKFCRRSSRTGGGFGTGQEGYTVGYSLEVLSFEEDAAQAEAGTDDLDLQALVVNGDFATGFDGWVVHDDGGGKGGQFHVRIVNDPQKQSCVELERTDSPPDGAALWVQQALDINLDEWQQLYLEADVKVLYNELSPGGAAGVEYPAQIALSMRDSNGHTRHWMHGFHYQNNEDGWKNCTRVPKGQWHHWRSPNLAAKNPDRSSNHLWNRRRTAQFIPAKVTAIAVRAQGWGMRSRITNLRFIGIRR